MSTRCTQAMPGRYVPHVLGKDGIFPLPLGQAQRFQQLLPLHRGMPRGTCRSVCQQQAPQLCRAMQLVPFAHPVASLTPPRVTQPWAPCDPQQRGGVVVARSAPRRAHRMFRQDSMAVVPPPKTQTVKKTMRSVVLNIICRA